MLFLTISVMAAWAGVSFVYLPWKFEFQSMVCAVGYLAFMLVACPKRPVIKAPVQGGATTKASGQPGVFPQNAQTTPVSPSPVSAAGPQRKRPTATAGSLRELMYAEIALINDMFKAHKIIARVNYAPSRTIPIPWMVAETSFIAYRVEIQPGQKLTKVDGVTDELSEALTDLRRTKIKGYEEKCIVRLRSFPLSLEVPHPDPKALTWQHARLDSLAPNTMLLGRIYDFGKAKDCKINLAETYHVLIAGMSGWGKSTLMRLALTSLVMNNRPDKLKIMLIDLKNADLWLFAKLPHSMGYVSDEAGAGALLATLEKELEQRKAARYSPYRIVVAIDELARIKDETIRAKLVLLMHQGREFDVNVIGGTQEPSAKEIGSEVNNAFQARIITRVASQDAAYFITKVAGSGAEQLIQKGAFLVITAGGEIERMKGFDLSREDNRGLIAQVQPRYVADIVPDTATYTPDTRTDMGRYEAGISPDMNKSTRVEYENRVHIANVRFPVEFRGFLTNEEQEEIRYLATLDDFRTSGEVSMSKLVPYVFGSRDPKRTALVRKALE